MLCAIILVGYRGYRSDLNPGYGQLKVTTWDALGYYMYLPAALVYEDLKELKWLKKIDEQYQLTGGELYQARLQENGQYIFKYLGGVAILQLPWFLLAHLIASFSDWPADGFSLPYQYTIAFGAVLYCILALALLRNLLLRFFNDRVVAISLILLVSATNLLQYVAVDSGMSHAYIFPLYALIIYFTIKWHQCPAFVWAALIGMTIGLATISRPTEAIMLFIPLFWNTHNKLAARKKWHQVKSHPYHVLVTVLFGLLAISPQLVYWYYATGSPIYEVGSKWLFFNPWFRVLFGFTNGWFIYTPITILFAVGLFYMKSFPFRRAIVVFSLLNIWIIISWFDWQYGATYSTRALVQSYPVLLFPFAAVLSHILISKWRFAFFILAAFLIFLNFFQLAQYQSEVLHSRDMNFHYYRHIFLNHQPSPLDMSLLDTEEILENPEEFDNEMITDFKGNRVFMNRKNSPDTLYQLQLSKRKMVSWLDISAEIKSSDYLWNNWLVCEVIGDDVEKLTKVRLYNAISRRNQTNGYHFHVKLPAHLQDLELRLYIQSEGRFKGELRSLKLIHYKPRNTAD